MTGWMIVDIVLVVILVGLMGTLAILFAKREKEHQEIIKEKEERKKELEMTLEGEEK